MDNINMDIDIQISERNEGKENIIVRTANAEDEADWRDLWASYNTFYEVRVPEETVDATWNRILDKDVPLNSIVVVKDNKIIGFANYVLHLYTWGNTFACLIDDLFVLESERSHGIGKFMIDTLIDVGKKQCWGRIYWMTREGNSKARILYDKFCKSDGFVRYSISFDGVVSNVGTDNS